MLGRLPTYSLVHVALNRPAAFLDHRRGALAWIYGRIRLTTRLLKACTDPVDGLIPRADAAWEFLHALPDSERP